MLLMPVKSLITNILIAIVVATCCLVSIKSKCYASSVADSTKLINEPINVRKPSATELESYRSQREFSYSKDLQPVENLWQKFWRWIAIKIGELLSKTSYDYFWRPLFYIFLIATIVFVVLKLFGVELRMFIKPDPVTVDVPYQLADENIYELNLDELSYQAAQQKNYRLAVRYHYLKVLKQLNDKGYIEWRTGKTNRTYATELSKGNFYRVFIMLTLQFEYIWYGEFNIDLVAFEKVKAGFITFEKEINDIS